MTTVRRIKSLGDKSAWLLILPASLLLFALDPSMIKTVAVWILVSLVLAGAAIVVSRITFPQIVFGDLLIRAVAGNRACAIVLAALICTWGLIFLSLVLWARG
ncbi:hypothetical protein [Pseudomonas sp. PS01301]|uniref:hypothetical protein n=1 Tax=Pseudomonas sp. PS01301 TaxID=2991437 RepID=UPI002499E7DB|nr:hypothetical protein [Pseudomonas sp. PS01301]